METLIRTELEADGVLVATIDMPGRTMNVFSAGLMDALDLLMDRVDTDPAVRGVVLTSGKSSFLAGADLAMVRGYCDAARTATPVQMFERCGRLGRQFVRLEASAKPWVAAVNGLALGGGLELALACRTRLVADDPKIQLGVPEVRLGLLPGAGGTQRLPRMIGFDPAMDMLLSGRPIDPQRAVELGMFERALPAAQLLDEARATVRRLDGSAHDATLKFRDLAQADTPAHTPEVAREVALAHGVTAADFDRYPAYSAIVDSVLLGARQSLAEATATEMEQFLRLMFSPVAGHMVRTLFLNRQRADRELAPSPGLRIERVTHGKITPARQAWADALAKSKLPIGTDPTMPADSIELLDNGGARHRIALRVLDDAQRGAEAGGATAVLSPVGPYGRVLEIVGGDEPTADALAALAQRLWALPWPSHTPRSALLAHARAPADDADAQALAALALGGPNGGFDFHDVAACTAGVAPAWSGGPYTHLWHQRERLVPRLDATAVARWREIEPALRELHA